MTRPCRVGDTIECVRPIQTGPQAGQHLAIVPKTPKACAVANDLIAAGRWRVRDCGACEKPIGECRCGPTRGSILTST